MISFSVVVSLLLFNGLLAYFYAGMKSTYRDEYPFKKYDEPKKYHTNFDEKNAF